jgi:hypothetical protein
VSIPLQPLTPLFTSVTLSLVAAACAASRHRVTDTEDTFGFSPVLGYLMLFCGVFFCIAPLLPRAAGDIPKPEFFFMFAPGWGGAFLASIFFFRYRVVLTDTTLTVGAFQRRQLSVDDIIDWDVIKGQRNSELVVYLRDGGKLRLSGLLSDFDQLVGMVNSHMAMPPRGQVDSAAKQRDRARRNGESRVAGWIVSAGLVLIAVALYVTSRIR